MPAKITMSDPNTLRVGFSPEVRKIACTMLTIACPILVAVVVRPLNNKPRISVIILVT